MTKQELQQRQAYPLDLKIAFSLQRIREWARDCGSAIHVAFSGGIDSTVLLHLVRRAFPKTPGVFVNTDTEWPEVRAVVKEFENVEWLKPGRTFREVLAKNGYPVISQEVSKKVRDLRESKSETLKARFLYGDAKGNGKLPKKWLYLVDAPFRISEQCCRLMKRTPMERYNRQQASLPFVGVLAEESNQRTMDYLKRECNRYDGGRPQSFPLGFWTKANIWEYAHAYSLPYAPIYDMGYTGTGCIYCAFGVHLEKRPNRFERMKVTHPKLYAYGMETLGLASVLDYLHVAY